MLSHTHVHPRARTDMLVSFRLPSFLIAFTYREIERESCGFTVTKIDNLWLAQCPSLLKPVAPKVLSWHTGKYPYKPQQNVKCQRVEVKNWLLVSKLKFFRWDWFCCLCTGYSCWVFRRLAIFLPVLLSPHSLRRKCAKECAHVSFPLPITNLVPLPARG